MKKILALLLIFVMLFSLVACGADSGNAKNKEITLNLSFGSKTGKYTGPLNENGLPEGEGSFTYKMESGISWTYKGAFVNGHFEGEGEISFSDKTITSRKGVYKNDEIQPISSVLVPAVYTKTEQYVGNCVEMTGKVFNVFADSEGYPVVQVYQDVDNSSNNTLLFVSSGDFKEGDFVRFTGIITGVEEYKNAFGEVMKAVGCEVDKIEKVKYSDAVRPTLKEVKVDQTQTQHGYSITVLKVEFAEKETRVYVKVKNDGKSSFSFFTWSSEVVQNSNTRKAEHNFEANYQEVSSSIRPGTFSSGIIVFPKMAQSDFTLYLDGMSDDLWETFDEMKFDIAVK